MLLLLFPGYFFVHDNCAVWSENVAKRAIKGESGASSEKTPEKKKQKAETLAGVDLAVLKSINQKCLYCKHFGASVKCKASGTFYHFPCAAASGSFMHKPTLTLVGTDSLSKVSGYGKNNIASIIFSPALRKFLGFFTKKIPSRF
jgi:hypothetical protein